MESPRLGFAFGSGNENGNIFAGGVKKGTEERRECHLEQRLFKKACQRVERKNEIG